MSGNPIATAAGLAQLKLLNASSYIELEKTAGRLAEGFEAVFYDAGIDAVVPRVGPLLSIFFTDQQPSNFDEAQSAAENGIYPQFFHQMLKRGVALAPGPYEALFPSLTHTEAIIDQTIEIARSAAAEMTN